MIRLHTIAINISIHSPHMGRDVFRLRLPATPENFNPLSPHGERLDVKTTTLSDEAFQSTLPTWGETYPGYRRRRRRNFNPLSPHGERPGRYPRYHGGTYFNPLSPHGERHLDRANDVYWVLFQSTLPTWGETFSAKPDSYKKAYFNPLSPHGERPVRLHQLVVEVISIHSPHMGRDIYPAIACPLVTNFNPLSPHGERQQTHTTFRREKLAHLHNIVSFRQQRGSSC